MSTQGVGDPCVRCDHGEGMHRYGYVGNGKERHIEWETPCQVPCCECEGFVPAYRKVARVLDETTYTARCEECDWQEGPFTSWRRAAILADAHNGNEHITPEAAAIHAAAQNQEARPK